MELDSNYWEERYKNNQVGWDLGVISPPLKAYFEQIKDKSLKILIPGAGNSYEAEYLFKLGFMNVYILDFAQSALDNFSARNPDFPKSHLVCSDFFDLKGQFDLIIEQTFFCAIQPPLRNEYVKKMNELLRKGGKLVGVLFNRNFEDGPPFGGHQKEYVKLFDPHFSEIKIEECYNSIAPRNGSEVFINCMK